MRSRLEIEELVAAHTQRYFTDKTSRSRRRIGITKLLNWLEPIEDSKIAQVNWQERWNQRGEPAEDWQSEAGAVTRTERVTLSLALQTLILEGEIRPSYAWLLRIPQYKLYDKLRTLTEKEHFDHLQAVAATATVSAATVEQAGLVLGKIIVHTGKHLPEITTVDLQVFAAAANATGRFASGVRVAHQLLRAMGWITDPPLTSGYAIRLKKLSIAELVEPAWYRLPRGPRPLGGLPHRACGRDRLYFSQSADSPAGQDVLAGHRAAPSGGHLHRSAAFGH